MMFTAAMMLILWITIIILNIKATLTLLRTVHRHSTRKTVRVIVYSDITHYRPTLIQCHTLIFFTCLCGCLHPPPGVAHLPHYPQCIYTCFLCLSVASLSCLVRSYQHVFPSPCFLKFSSLVSPVLTILLALTPSLPAVLYLPDSDLFTNLCLS